MNVSNLEKALAGESGYRMKQAREAIYKNFISNWDEATFFSKNLRDKLNKECPLEIKADVLVAKDEDSVKIKITLKDGLEIESVLMRHKDGRNTVCVSTQVGCAMNCAFCATGKMGFKRNLTAEEIIEQVLFFERYFKNLNDPKGAPIKNCVTNVTFMGMGEPFLNYDNVMESIRLLNNKDYFNIGGRHISVSTCGIIEGIEKFSKEGSPFNLAISLHASNNELRQKIMPIAKQVSLEKLFKAIDSYILKTNRKVMFEYVMIKDVNDSVGHAQELASLMRKKLYFVNLILYNNAGNADVFKPSETKQVEKFKAILEKAKVRYTQRYRFGDDIQAACGQFATK